MVEIPKVTGMSEFVNNPRRTPRALIGCDARVALKDGRFFTTETLDYGPRGCQLVAPAPLATDERVFVELRGCGVSETFFFSGRVAWADPVPPFRAGVHFDEGCCADARGFFFRLADANPDAACTVQPMQLADDALLTPTRRTMDEALLPGEAEVLRAVGAGLLVRELRALLGERWEPCLNPLFSLLARGELTAKADPTEPTP